MPAISWTDDAGLTVALLFDVIETENHEGTVEITEHPVEDGAVVADHARPVPERLTIEAFVSNVPTISNPGVSQLGSNSTVSRTMHTSTLGAPQVLDLQYPPPQVQEFLSLSGAIRTGINLLTRPKTVTGRGAMQNVDQNVDVQALNFASYTNRFRLIAEKLADARLNGRLIRVTTAVRDYDNMMIERESEPRKVEDGSGCSFQIDLKRVRFVSTQTVAAPKPAEARGSPSKNKGSQAAKDDPNGKNKFKSINASLFDAAFGGDVG